jgi:hypothetical protein
VNRINPPIVWLLDEEAREKRISRHDARIFLAERLEAEFPRPSPDHFARTRYNRAEARLEAYYGTGEDVIGEVLPFPERRG